VAVATASPTQGASPLAVTFDGSGSSDPDPGDTLSMAWDLDGDLAFDDSTATGPTFSYTSPGVYTATLRVTDSHGATSTDSVEITVGNTAPTAAIDLPSPSTLWRVGDVIRFDGHATDPQEGLLPPSALSWDVVMHHCPSTCHTHVLQSYAGVSGGEFVAPDHEAPAYLELRLTATDSGGLTSTASVRLDPQMVTLTFATVPGGLTVALNDSAGKATFTRSVIVGSSNTLSAPSPQTKGKQRYTFVSWSDRGTQTHTITAPAVATTYTARFK
jgi:PKD repeat protein